MSHSLHAAVASLRSRTWPYEDAVHDYENVYLKLTRRLEQLLGTTRLQGLHVLDLGCGYYYPNVALLHANGVEVCGADVERVFFRDGRVATFRQRLRERGLLRAAYWAGPRMMVIGATMRLLPRLPVQASTIGPCRCGATTDNDFRSLTSPSTRSARMLSSSTWRIFGHSSARPDES